LRLSLDLTAFSGAVPSPFNPNDKYVVDDTYDLIRTCLKICGNFRQIHPDRHNMKKVSSDPPDLGRSQEKSTYPINFGWL